MTKDFAKPSTTKKADQPMKSATRKKGSSAKAGRHTKKEPVKKPSGATPSVPSSDLKPQRSKTPFYVGLVLLIVAFAYGIYFLQSIPPTNVTQKTIDESKAKPKSEPTQKSTKTEPEESDTKRFNFYDILPNTTVTPPKVEEYQYREKNRSDEYRYMVQTGSFRSIEDAERQKAMIALQGLKSSIRTVRNDQGNVWHRVETGPFNNRSKLNAALDKLVAINIQPLVKKIKIEE